MTITEALPATDTTSDALAAAAGTAAANGSATGRDVATGKSEAPSGTADFRPVPVWFFAFEGLMGASFDILKAHPDGWMVIAGCAAVNLVLASTVLRGRLKMAKAMLKGKRTRKIALGLVALRLGVHVVLGAIGMHATSGWAHLAFAAGMCAATVGLLAFDQRVVLRALCAEQAASAGR
ncbi:hypothetical protein [Streptomyces sp. NRRL F-5123]|uniref:hypothetical protein n=1 Tax=Streptomyces sp. NRRL F-5123 TaxID=1463856 RepID=UPI000A74A920|nr:hypothetical protein [Streptomyces sp. NRRL F-5123]